MAFTTASAKIWPVPPEWTNGVSESLAWSTDVLQANATAVTQHRGLRIGPRRTLTFDVVSDAQHRRVADMLLASHGGVWELPMWHDFQWLAAPLAGGVEEIPCVPDGRDFVVGGRALLWSAVNRWEIVEIAAIEPDHIALAEPTAVGYAVGSRLSPVRRARVQDGAKEHHYNDEVSRRSLTFDIVEPCDWPVLDSPTLYLSHPVLDVRPDETNDLTSSYSRLVQTVDYGTGLPVVHDLPGLGLRAQQCHWTLVKRAEHSWYRSLLYTLCGRRVPMWIPSWASDLKPVAAIAGGSTTLSIEWAAYTLFGFGKHNRKDVRIELTDGSVHYRRITNSVEAGATETLTLSAALSGSAIAPTRIRAISFMTLSTLGSDSIEIEHKTDIDGVATSTTGWQAVVPDV